MKIITSITVFTSVTKLVLVFGLFFGIVNLVMSNSALTLPDTNLTNFCKFSGQFTQKISKVDASLTEMSNGVIFSDCFQGVIMHTQSPEIQTQIYTTKNKHYLVDQQNTIKAIKGIAKSLRAKLILSILSFDQDYIAQHFAVNADLLPELVLTPITKTYKRGLQSISISGIDNSDSSEGDIVIAILDKRGQSSTIVITGINEYDSQEKSVDNCAPLFSETAYCTILKSPEKYTNK